MCTLLTPDPFRVATQMGVGSRTVYMKRRNFITQRGFDYRRGLKTPDPENRLYSASFRSVKPMP